MITLLLTIVGKLFEALEVFLGTGSCRSPLAAPTSNSFIRGNVRLSPLSSNHSEQAVCLLR